MTSIAIEQAYALLGDFRLEDISVSVESGEFFVILGPSGAGKTVLLDLIAGFIYPRQGRVLLDGADISFLPTERRHIGYMFQDYALAAAYRLHVPRLRLVPKHERVQEHRIRLEVREAA